MVTDEQKQELALALHEIGAIKFGDFTYKSGTTGPMYLDLRLFISYPRVMKKIAKLYAAQLAALEFDRMAGVAYAALPITGAISLEMERPWVFLRKEGLKKDHGLGKSLEGEFKNGETVVMIEDLCMKATSLLEAIPAIESHGLMVKDAVVLLDYQKGGRENLAAGGYNLHAFMSVPELIEILHVKGKIDDAKYHQCVEFLKS